MTDLDRYLTEEMRDAATRALRGPLTPHRAYGPGDFKDATRAALTAVLPEVIRQAQAEALREMGDWFKLASDLGTGDRDLIAAQACYDRADGIDQGGQP